MITLDQISAPEHKILISDGTNDLAIDGSGYLTANINGSVTVTATDLDIRDLTAASDSVEIQTAAGQPLAIDGSGFITANINGDVNVTATDLDIRDLSASQDNVAISDGTDTLAIESDGSINVNTVPGGFSAWKVTAESVGTTVGEIVSTPLANRVCILIQNRGNEEIELAPATFTQGDGVVVPAKSSYEACLDDGADIWALAASGTQDVRVVEYAA